MDNQLPFDLESEQAVLGLILFDQELIVNVSDLLTVKDFYSLANQVIFQTMKDLKNTGLAIEYGTILSHLSQTNQLEKIGSEDYLFSLTNLHPSINHLDSYVRIVKDASIKRQVILKANDLSKLGAKSGYKAKELLDQLEEAALNLAKLRMVGDFAKINEITPKVMEDIHVATTSGGHIKGLSTGFVKLDTAISGLQPQELIVLASRPGMGKSAFAMNVVTQVCEQNPGASVAVFSLEMSNEQLIQRIFASFSSIDSKKIKNGNLTPKEVSEVKKAKDRLDALNIYLDDAATSDISDLRAKCRSLKIKGKLDVVIIDYLQLLSDSEPAPRHEQIAKISRSLKQMARELQIPVIALSQLSRSVEKRESNKPVLSDLRESGSIEQDADIVLFIYRPDYYAKEGEARNFLARLYVAKNRHGSTEPLNFTFDPVISTFKQYDGEVIEEED